jgi:predicted nucleic acid-binding protein
VIVVIDTNVWISALQFAKHHGTPTLALEKAMSEKDLLTLDTYKGMRIITPSEYLGAG